MTYGNASDSAATFRRLSSLSDTKLILGKELVDVGVQTDGPVLDCVLAKAPDMEFNFDWNAPIELSHPRRRFTDQETQLLKSIPQVQDWIRTHSFASHEYDMAILNSSLLRRLDNRHGKAKLRDKIRSLCRQ
jgi:hypothetical protein